MFRIIDANFNRTREALRVIEDGVRFCGDTEKMASDIRKIRHDFTKTVIDSFGESIIQWRDVETDPGKDFSIPVRTTVDTIIRRNFSRAGESMRVIEEYSKTIFPEYTSTWAKLRFRVYQMEKAFCALFFPVLPPKPFLCLLLPQGKGKASSLRSRDAHIPEAILIPQCRNTATFLRASRTAVRNYPHTIIFVEEQADIALLSGAKGLLLSTTSLPVAEAKKVLPGAIVGIRCPTWKNFLNALRQHPDFLLIEDDFSDSHASGIEFLTNAQKNSTLPLVAGINATPVAAEEIFKAGAIGIITTSAFPRQSMRYVQKKKKNIYSNNEAS